MQPKRRLRIVPYNPHWPDEFRTIAAEIRAAVGDQARRIDHIGSTAVPGLAAKDVIDIQITVDSLDRAAAIVDALAAMGYVPHPALAEDHLPPGIELPPVERRKRFLNGPPGMRPMNIHVREEGRFNQRYPLLFRDYLRAHPPSAAAYAEIKRQLARLLPDDFEAYYDIKDPVCDLIMAGSYAWAEATRWQPGPPDG